MMINDSIETARFERKYNIADLTSAEVENFILLNPYGFRSIYYPRYVNNIYFDTYNLNSFFDNTEGVAWRRKYRIRWYGDLFGRIIDPTLEIKDKRGLVGTKSSYKLESFVIDKDMSFERINDCIRESELPLIIKREIMSMCPTLLNRYKRRYYVSKNEIIRSTIDDGLIFYKIHRYFNNFKQISMCPKVVLELKYAVSNDSAAQTVSQFFPFRVSKSSKYANGIIQTYEF